ncbi:hypothetical protein GQ457_18G016150 [Hibiscus cannabinus]
MMAESDERFEGDHATATSTRFSQLLFGGADDDFNYTSSFAVREHDKTTPKMLCFGEESAKKPVAGVACSESSSGSNPKSKSFKDPLKSNRSDDRESIVGAQPGSRRTRKKCKVENPTTGHAKVRKEKIGDRITALQQLVSPFGKTDTASVLHEAMGYIRFLHDQVQVLCSPYLQHPPNGDEEPGKELKSRGLCLVPVACTLHVANSNGADFWSPAMGNNVI